jgi:hypothetical protein
MDISLLSNLSMFMLMLGTLPSIVAVVKNRRNLSAFSLLGAVGLVIGQTGFLLYFALIGDWLTSGLSVVATVFWWFIMVYKLKEKTK